MLSTRLRSSMRCRQDFTRNTYSFIIIQRWMTFQVSQFPDSMGTSKHLVPKSFGMYKIFGTFGKVVMGFAQWHPDYWFKPSGRAQSSLVTPACRCIPVVNQSISGQRVSLILFDSFDKFMTDTTSMCRCALSIEQTPSLWIFF